MDLRIGTRVFADSSLGVMAIVNRTPDSFYDRGRTFAVDAALGAVDHAVTEGAAIIDIGGVKAGPGSDVDPAEERTRVVEFVGLVRERHADVAISVDTWRASVAAPCVEAGADLLNDSWGGADPDLARVAAESGAALVCTHVGGATPRTRPHRVHYADVVADVRDTLRRLADRALALGVRPDGLVIDPAHDFGKNSYHSLEVTRRLGELTALGWPVLVSLSRKDFVGECIDRPPDDRLAGTLAATAVSAWLGARLFRAHDVAATVQALQVVAAIRDGREPVAAARRGLA